MNLQYLGWFLMLGKSMLNYRNILGMIVLVIAVNGAPKPNPKPQMAIILPGKMSSFNQTLQKNKNCI